MKCKNMLLISFIILIVIVIILNLFIDVKPKTECEKGNPEYMLNFCLRDEIFVSDEKRSDEKRYCGYKCPENKSEWCWMPMDNSKYQDYCMEKEKK